MPIKPLLRKDIVYAQTQTKSHAEAARYLNISFTTYKRWAKAYELYENEHKNAAGKGVVKHRSKGMFGLQDILAGKYPNYDRHKLKERLIRSSYLPNACAVCGHNQTRPDGRAPHTLDYKDGDRLNLQLDNLQLICYNCQYLTTGRISVNTNDILFSDADYEEVLGQDELDALRKELQDL